MSIYDTINQKVVEYLNLLIDQKKARSQADLARMLKESPQYVNNIIKGLRKPGKEFPDKLVAVFPDAEVFIFGSKSHEPTSNARIWPEQKDKMPIPLVYERAHAGFTDHWGDREWMEDLPIVWIDKKTDGVYLAFEVSGDSMEDGTEFSLCHGDRIVGREVYREHWVNRLHIPDVFIIAMRNDGILVKEITKHDVEKGIVTCRSYNQSYEDLDINLSEVVKLYHYKELIFRKRRRRY